LQAHWLFLATLLYVLRQLCSHQLRKTRQTKEQANSTSRYIQCIKMYWNKNCLCRFLLDYQFLR